MEPERLEIINYVLETGLAEKCVSYRLNKCKDPYIKEELLQELYVWLCEYDILKLQDAYEKKHMSALITRWIINNYFSKSSPFYTKHRKFSALSDDITEKELNIPE